MNFGMETLSRFCLVRSGSFQKSRNRVRKIAKVARIGGAYASATAWIAFTADSADYRLRPAFRGFRMDVVKPLTAGWIFPRDPCDRPVPGPFTVALAVYHI